MRGKVTLNGQRVVKPSAVVVVGAALAVADDYVAYVSRGAEKLVAALDTFRFDAVGRVAVDIGASTGGFTDLLLRRGAAKVHAVDVGREQLHASLRADPRITLHEATDARRLDRALIPELIGAVVADVSFISLTKVLPAALSLTTPGCWLAALVKPQFEAGREAIGKGGIVRDPAIQARVRNDMEHWLGSQPGWRVFGTIPSPITGSDGNIEFLIGAMRHE